jgi:hypothetical protein
MQRDAELAGRTRDLLDVGEGVDMDVAVERRRGEPGRQRAHRAVLGGEGLGELCHVAAQRLLAFDEMDVDAGVGELLSGTHAGDAAADDQRRAAEEGAAAG